MNLLASWTNRVSAARPEAVALILPDETLSYRQLLDHSHTLAQQFDGAQGAVLALQAESMAAVALSAHAASRLGRALFPLGPAISSERREVLLQAAGAQIAANIELFIATSGTQGEPKVVMLSGANLQAGVQASRSCLPLQAGNVWLNCLPLYHIGGMAILYRCAEAGAAVVLHEGFDPQRVRHDLETHRVTHISLVPAMLARLLDLTHGAPPPSALKYALVGGGALTAALARRARVAGWPLCVTYGMSETGSQLATCPLPDDWQPGCVGVPLPGFEVRIADEREGGAGVIHVRGAAVMAGYAHADGKLGHGLEEGWLTTGDLGKIDASGHLHVLGRADDMLVSGGVNVHPAVVEAALMTVPGVEDAAVSALPDEIWGDLVVALVVGPIDPVGLEHWCREHLAGAMRPRLVRQVSALPRNALGKLERETLKNMVMELTSENA